MPPRPPPPPRTHPIVKAAALIVVIAAAGAGVWMGSRGATPRPVPIDPNVAQDLFLPATSDEPTTSSEVERGAALFEDRCAGCHTVGGGDRKEGPDLAMAAFRRDPLWVNAMVQSPDSMFRTDSLAKWVLSVHGIAPEQATGDNPDLAALASFLKTFQPGR